MRLTRRQQGVAAIVAGVLVSMSAGVAVLGQTAVVERRGAAPPPPSKGEGGSTLVAPNPQPIDPRATPVAFGPYRLVPPGFVGELASEEVDLPKGVKTSDSSVIRRSPLYREIPAALLPAGASLLRADTGEANTEEAIHLVYGDPKTGDVHLEVFRGRPWIRPINVNYGGGSTEARIIDGRYVLIDELLSPPPLPTHVDQTRHVFETNVRMGVEGLDLVLVSTKYDADLLIKIGLELVP